jgi:diaminopimelate epimerase
MDGLLSLRSRFFKAHGHGNDYLVFEEGTGWEVDPVSVQKVCHRQRGVGSDGIVALLRGPGHEDKPRPPFRLRMFNPDGGEFERSGNGLRVFGAYLFTRGWVEVGVPFPVEVGGDRVSMEILEVLPGGELSIAVDMGEVSFGLEAVAGDPKNFGSGPSLVGPRGQELTLNPVSVGNPHCVVFLDELGEEDLLALGPFLTSYAGFTAGTNVQLAKELPGNRVEILIWERGVGRTASSGTSACAAAAASVRTGRAEPGPVRVEMEGGTFTVTVSPTWEVRLEGPVEPLFEGAWGLADYAD